LNGPVELKQLAERTLISFPALEMVKDKNKSEALAASRLSLRHTYLPKSPVDLAGHCNLGGKDDQPVLCAGKGALTGLLFSMFHSRYIHIWDRESGTLQHHV
jgi:WD repeat-containing protein 26